MPPCNLCGREGVPLKCSRCRSVYYCDRTCQKQDWITHKAGCKPPGTPAGRFPLGENMLLSEVETAKHLTTKCDPEPEMFPAELCDFQYRSSPDGVNENLLILLHGRGDLHKSFTAFAENLNLPQTAYLALSGPIRLPELIVSGRLWFETYDLADDWAELRPGDIKRAESMKATQRLLDVMIQALCSRCGWRRSRIFLLGYGDGGTVALGQGLASCGQNRLGGVISISGPIFLEHTLKENLSRPPACMKDCTPVLITYGTKAREDHLMDIERSRSCLDEWHSNPQAKVVGVTKEEGMVRTPEEAQVLHQFFADQLSIRMINMEKNSTLYEVIRS